MKKLAILGAGGHGKVAAEIAEKQGWDKIDFYDVSWPDLKQSGDWYIVGDETQFFKCNADYDSIFVAIGDNGIRREKLEQLQTIGCKAATLIAASATISPRASIGDGVLIAEGTCISVDTTIGDGVIINTGATVDHDCIIDSFAHICPGVNLSGSVRIGESSWIGTGSSIIPGITVGKMVMAGAGSVIINDIPAASTIAGVPAKPIQDK